MDSLDYLRVSLGVTLVLFFSGRFVGQAPATWRIFPYLSSLIFGGFYVWSAFQANINFAVGLIVIFVPVSAVVLLQRWPLARRKNAQQDAGHFLRTLGLFAVLFFPQISRLFGNGFVPPLGFSYMLFRLYDALQRTSHSEISFSSRSSGVTEASTVVLQTSAFPTLVAGPILLRGQVRTQRAPFCTGRAFDRRAVLLLLLGTGKLFILLPLVDTYLETGLLHPLSLSLFSLRNVFATGLYHYLRLYTEFSGYTDFVVALCGLMGLRIQHNFLRPYLAVSLRDFWRRWHITLSTFIGKHIYMPLGGRGSRPIIHARNLVISFALIGLWHGMTVPFLLWGVMHAGFLVLETYVITPFLPKGSLVARLGQFVSTQLFVLLSWVVFFWK